MSSYTTIFIYGTLRRGGTNERVIREHGGVRLEGAETAPGFQLVDCGRYPGLIRRDDSTVVGELWRIPTGALPKLDAFEEVPTLYTREMIELSDGRRVYSYILVEAHVSDKAVILNGDWMQR